MTNQTEIVNLVSAASRALLIKPAPVKLKQGFMYTATLLIPDDNGYQHVHKSDVFFYNPHTEDSQDMFDLFPRLFKGLFPELPKNIELDETSLDTILNPANDLDWNDRIREYKNITRDLNGTTVTINGKAIRYSIKKAKYTQWETFPENYFVVITAAIPWKDPTLEARNKAMLDEWVLEVERGREQAETHLHNLSILLNSGVTYA
jgi:hypothetical protein